MKVELIEQALEIVNDKQLLINIVSKRVRQINQGADPFIPTTPDMGSADIALTEIIEGKIVWRAMTEEDLEAANAPSVVELFAESSELPEATEVAEEVATVTILAD